MVQSIKYLCEILNSPSVRYIFCLSYPLWFHHCYNILWRVQIMKFSFIEFSPRPCHFIPLMSKHYSKIYTPSTYLPNQVSQLYKAYDWNLYIDYFLACNVKMLFRLYVLFIVPLELNCSFDPVIKDGRTSTLSCFIW